MTNDPNEHRVAGAVAFDTRNLPRSYSIRTYTCGSPDCKHGHAIGFDEYDRAIFHFTYDAGLLRNMHLTLIAASPPAGSG